MRRILFVLLLLTTSCGYFLHVGKVPEANVEAGHPIQKYSQQELDRFLNYIYAGYGMGRLEGWSILFTDDYIRYGRNGIADGLTIPAEKLILVHLWRGCLADSSLVHEIGHALAHTNETDLHDDEEFRLKKIRIYKNAKKDLCPKGYSNSHKQFNQAIEE